MKVRSIASFNKNPGWGDARIRMTEHRIMLTDIATKTGEEVMLMSR